MLNYGEISLKRPRHNFCAGTRDAGDRRDRVGACRPADGARWRVRFRAREPRGLERVDDMRRAGGAADSHSEMNSDSLRFILYSEARLIKYKQRIKFQSDIRQQRSTTCREAEAGGMHHGSHAPSLHHLPMAVHVRWSWRWLSLGSRALVARVF